MKAKLSLVALVVLAATALQAGTETTSGTIYNQNGQYAKAVEILKVAVQKDPKDAKAHYQIGFAYSNLDSVGLAYVHFVKAAELEPKMTRDAANNIQSNYAKHYKLGQTHFARASGVTAQAAYADAAREFGLATQADPKQAGAHYNLAVAYSRMAETDSTYDDDVLAAASKVLEVADPKDPNYMRALQLTARALAAQGREAEAAAKFQPLIDADPSKYEVVEEIGNDLLKREKWKGASTFLKMAAEARSELGASDFNTYFNVGLAEFKQREANPACVDSSIVYYEKALTINSEDPNAVYNLMAAYTVKQDWSNASLVGEKYVSLSPADPNGWRLLARCYGELGDDAKASEALQRFQQLQSQ